MQACDGVPQEWPAWNRLRGELCVERIAGGEVSSRFLVITRGNLDHLFSYAAGNGGDQKSDLALQACGPEGLEKAGKGE
ncbi:hypothetical protein CRENBAI_008867, partial [Crenichthys baileyi]